MSILLNPIFCLQEFTFLLILNLRLKTIMIFYPSNVPNLLNMFFEVVNVGISLLATLKKDEKMKSSGMDDSMSMNMISRGDQHYDEDEDDEDEGNPSPELINVAFKQMLSADSIMKSNVDVLLQDTLQKMGGIVGSDQYAQMNQALSMASVGKF